MDGETAWTTRLGPRTCEEKCWMAQCHLTAVLLLTLCCVVDGGWVSSSEPWQDGVKCKQHPSAVLADQSVTSWPAYCGIFSWTRKCMLASCCDLLIVVTECDAVMWCISVTRNVIWWLLWLSVTQWCGVLVSLVMWSVDCCDWVMWSVDCCDWVWRSDVVY